MRVELELKEVIEWMEARGHFESSEKMTYNFQINCETTDIFGCNCEFQNNFDEYCLTCIQSQDFKNYLYNAKVRDTRVCTPELKSKRSKSMAEEQ